MKVMIAGVGNIFLSDDGFGSEVARRLERTPMPEGVRVKDYGISGVHLAFDLAEGYDLLVLIDALPGDDEPGTINLMEVGLDDIEGGVLDAHGMDPGSMLASLKTLGGAFPRTLLVGCQPATVEEGMGLSPEVEASVEVAASKVVELVEREIDGALAPE